MTTFKTKNNILELICRTCLRKNKVRFNLFKHFQNDRLILDMAMECLPIRMHQDDGFPANICSNCLKKLNSACNFKAMALQSDAKLHFFKENKILQNENILQNISSINIDKETTTLKSKQTDILFDLNEKDNLMEKQNVTNNIEHITSFTFPSEQSKSQTNIYLNNIQLSNCNIIQSVFSTNAKHNEISDVMDTSNCDKSENIGQAEIVCPNNLTETPCTTSKFKYLKIPDSVNYENEVLEETESKNELGSFFDDFHLSPTRSNSSDGTEEKQGINRRNPIMSPKTNDKTFKCDGCYKSFTRECLLKQHMRIHTETKEFTCNVCEKKFRTLRGAQIHKTTHLDERPYKCSVCDKTFKYSDTLKHHLLIHKNDKKIVCELCGKSFINSAGLIHHKATHNTERNFVCTICGKCFKSQPRLSDHLRRHSDTKPYTCRYCDSRFKCSNVLKSHILIHTGAKPFSCKICDKKFRQRPSLRYHMRIHTGETPYECELCSYKFKYKQHLSNHMKVHVSDISDKQISTVNNITKLNC